MLDNWKRSDNIIEIYFVTATFSEESSPYFPNTANHYTLASFKDIKLVMNDFISYNTDKISFAFGMQGYLFERVGMDLNFISIYFTKYTYGLTEMGDLANVIAKRDRVKKVALANMHTISNEQLRFTFPYSDNIILLEVDGGKTHQSDQKYCERTRRDVARKGIPLTNLVSFSILEKLK